MDIGNLALIILNRPSTFTEASTLHIDATQLCISRAGTQEMPALDTSPNGPVASLCPMRGTVAVSVPVKDEQPRTRSFEVDSQPKEELGLECGSRSSWLHNTAFWT